MSVPRRQAQELAGPQTVLNNPKKQKLAFGESRQSLLGRQKRAVAHEMSSRPLGLLQVQYRQQAIRIFFLVGETVALSSGQHRRKRQLETTHLELRIGRGETVEAVSEQQMKQVVRVRASGASNQLSALLTAEDLLIRKKDWSFAG
jgi:hypothetical protein